ncbi:hypothetical protein Tco_1335220 [Tanacetum coccineum]
MISGVFIFSYAKDLQEVFRTDYVFVGTLDGKIRRDPDREIGYEITNVWEDPDKIAEEIPATDVAELGQRMTNFVQSMDASDMASFEVRALRTTVLAQQTEIGDLRTQMVALESQQRPVRDPAHPDVPEEAGSSS